MKKAVPYLITIILILVVGGVFFKLYYDHYMYTNERQDLDAYYGVQDEDDFPVIYENLVSDMHARRFDGACYMDLETVRSLLNSRFYYGTEDNVLIYCLPEEKFVARAGEKSWESDVSGVTQESYAPLVLDGDTVYVALDYVKKFTNIYYAAYEGPNRVVLRNAWGTEKMATVRGSTNMRTLGGVKAPIIAAVEEGTEVLVLEELDDWTRIETADGYYGYVESKYLSEVREQEMEPVTDVPEYVPQYRSLDGKACIAWNLTYFADSNVEIDGMLKGTKAINVLAPTWFTLSSEDGNINVKASRTYVKKAHENGMQVWGVLDNFQNDDLFVYTRFLNTLAGRQKVIDTLIEEAQSYNLDGINVDIEGLAEATDVYDFIEFVREISIACRRAGLFISVNNYVPYNYNDHYDLKEQAAFADYVIIMGYDEHIVGSEEAGSVASIGYVEYGIEEALMDVPAERLINGIPFYTIGWTTENGNVSGQTLDMAEAKAFMKEHDMKKEWNSTAGQNYAEKESGNKLYQIWLEDKKSIETKLDLMESNGLAGLAVWRLGLETNDVWDEIDDYVKK
ncbi:MAG: glycosyl hydrolase family 18 protein [Lachnospiraceae bacterium]|jgi:spore germination protein YaaH|nr:glycosyl hydrolase family 18 protein [Lachnospiraceae bacterium]